MEEKEMCVWVQQPARSRLRRNVDDDDGKILGDDDGT